MVDISLFEATRYEMKSLIYKQLAAKKLQKQKKNKKLN